MRGKTDFRRCRRCKVETPHTDEGWCLGGRKRRCRVCGTLWLDDGMVTLEVREGRRGGVA